MNREADDFEAFAIDGGERLRRVLVARLGVDVGNDVTNEALTYAWEHWDRMRTLDNPVGYLYRVAQSAARRHARWRRSTALLPAEERSTELGSSLESVEPRLPTVLAALKPLQRTCIVLVHVYNWTYEETAGAIGISTGAVRNHLHRGLRRLRTELKDEL